MKKTLLILASSTLLVACGGGGGSDAVGTPPTSSVNPPPVTPPPAAKSLANYAGTWQTACNSNQMETDVLTANADGSLSYAYKIEYFLAGSKCTGTPIATQTANMSQTLTYNSTIAVSVRLNIFNPETQIRLDKLDVTTPPYKNLVSGPGVESVIEDGQAKWCFHEDSTSRSCFKDEGEKPGSKSTGGFYMQDNTLYLISGIGTLFRVDQTYTRK
jgi:hypothetical protein